MRCSRAGPMTCFVLCYRAMRFSKAAEIASFALSFSTKYHGYEGRKKVSPPKHLIWVRYTKDSPKNAFRNSLMEAIPGAKIILTVFCDSPVTVNYDSLISTSSSMATPEKVCVGSGV